jgi:hypothetical protein
MRSQSCWWRDGVSAGPSPHSAWATHPRLQPGSDSLALPAAPPVQAPVHATPARADTAATQTGICLAVAQMNRGERALVYVTDPAYGYGQRGSFSFPSVPPSCGLVYDIRLLQWDPVDAVRPSLAWRKRPGGH